MVQAACNVKIVNNGHTVKTAYNAVSMNWNVSDIKDAVVTLEGDGTYISVGSGSGSYLYPAIANYGTMIIKGGTFATEGQGSNAIAIFNRGTMTIENATIKGEGVGVSSNADTSLTIKNATFLNCSKGISVKKGASVKIDGNITLENGYNPDVYLEQGATFDLTDRYTNEDHPINVKLAEDLKENTKRKITTSSTKEMQKYVTSYYGGYDVRYDDEGYLYLWMHWHTWKAISANDKTKTITLQCTSDPECIYYTDTGKTISLTLNPPEVETEGDGKSCIATVTGDTDIISRRSGSGWQLMYVQMHNGEAAGVWFDDDYAPKTAGDYYVQLSAGDKSVTYDYTIAPRLYTIDAPDCTVTPASARMNTEITVSAADGHKGEKLVSVTVKETESGDAVDVTDNEDGTFTFTMPAADVTVTGSYEKVPYTVTIQQGSATSTKTQYYNDTVTLTEDTTQTPVGKQLVGWKVNDVEQTENTFTMPDKDVTVEAVYDYIRYTVTVTQNGEQTLKKTDAHAEDEITLTVDDTKTPQGKKFIGWTVNGTFQTGNTFTMPAGDVTVTAEYDYIDYTVTVTQNGKETLNKTDAHIGDEITLTVDESLIPEGKQFKSWKVNNISQTANTVTVEDENLTIEAEYEPIQYTVTYVDEDGEHELTNKEMGDPITLPEAAAKKGYTFTRWTSDDVTVENGSFTMPAKNVTVKAEYEANDYTLTIQQGEPAETTGTETYHYEDIVTLTVDDAKTPAGKQFVGWKSDEVEIKENDGVYTFTMPDGDVTVTAEYDAIRYVVTIEDADGTSAWKKDAHYGDLITLPVAATKKGHSFAGWKLDGKALEQNDAGEYTFEMPAENVTVTADYAVNSYKLTIVSDGVGTEETEVPYDTTAEALPQENPGKMFTKWSIEGVDGLTEATDAKLSFTMPDHDVTVTASYRSAWEEPDDAKPTNDNYVLTVEDGKATVNGQPLDDQGVKAGDTIVLTADAAPQSMAFNGWSFDTDLLAAINEARVEAQEELLDEKAETVEFVMPDMAARTTANEFTVRATYCPDEIAEVSGANPWAVAAGVAVGGAATGVLVWQGANLGAEMYLKYVLPKTAEIPTTRQGLALLLWQDAGKPEAPYALYEDIDSTDTDAQKATHWAVANGLIDPAKQDGTTLFDPTGAISRWTVLKAWNKAQKLK